MTDVHFLPSFGSALSVRHTTNRSHAKSRAAPGPQPIFDGLYGSAPIEAIISTEKQQ